MSLKSITIFSAYVASISLVREPLTILMYSQLPFEVGKLYYPHFIHEALRHKEACQEGYGKTGNLSLPSPRLAP